jgi:IS1 family transposase
MMNDNLYIFLHIPRTGGTFIEHCFGSFYDRTNERYLKHYSYTSELSEFYLFHHRIPLLSHRTKEQQNKLKIITGHSTHCRSDLWVRTKRKKKIFAVIRNPIDRLLSSFNHKHELTVLKQDKSCFTSSYPTANKHSTSHQKTAEDYDTLYEYYCDVNSDQNLQTKWLLKSFTYYSNDKFYDLKEYYDNVDLSETDLSNQTWPTWFCYKEFDDYFELLKPYLSQLWKLYNFDDLEDEMEKLSKIMDTEWIPDSPKNESGTLVPKYWTLEDVMNQPDIELLIESEKYDFRLYDLVSS